MAGIKNHWNTLAMKNSIAGAALAAALLLSPPLRAQQPDPNPIPPPSQPAPSTPNAPTAPVPPSTPAAGASPSSQMMRTWRRLIYTCDGDAKAVVNLHAKMARVVFKGHTYNMKQVDEANGQKYTDGSLVWRNKDDVGSLERASKSGSSKSLAAGCHLQSASTNPPAATPPANPQSNPRL
jgi:membrane-bound inhibitor of C-type lysozyme